MREKKRSLFRNDCERRRTVRTRRLGTRLFFLLPSFLFSSSALLLLLLLLPFVKLFSAAGSGEWPFTSTLSLHGDTVAGLVVPDLLGVV